MYYRTGRLYVVHIPFTWAETFLHQPRKSSTTAVLGFENTKVCSAGGLALRLYLLEQEKVLAKLSEPFSEEEKQRLQDSEEAAQSAEALARACTATEEVIETAEEMRAKAKTLEKEVKTAQAHKIKAVQQDKLYWLFSSLFHCSFIVLFIAQAALSHLNSQIRQNFENVSVGAGGDWLDNISVGWEFGNTITQADLNYSWRLYNENVRPNLHSFSDESHTYIGFAMDFALLILCIAGMMQILHHLEFQPLTGTLSSFLVDVYAKIAHAFILLAIVLVGFALFATVCLSRTVVVFRSFDRAYEHMWCVCALLVCVHD